MKSATRAGLAQIPAASQAASLEQRSAHEAPGAASCREKEDALPCTEGVPLLHVLRSASSYLCNLEHTRASCYPVSSDPLVLHVQ